MADTELIRKIREHLGKVRSAALILAHTQSGEKRNEYIKRLTDELKKANALLDKIEQS